MRALAAIALGFMLQGVLLADVPPARSALVMESLDVAYRFEDDGVYTHTVRARILVATEEGRRALGELYFPYHERSSQLTLGYMRTVKASGETIEIPPDQLFDVAPPAGQRSPVFSDLKYKAVPVPGLEVGDHFEYEKTTTHHTPLVPGQFWGHHRLTRHLVVHRETVRLDLPGDRELAFEMDGSIDHVVEHRDGRAIHTWNHTNLDPDKTEPRAKYLFNLSTFNDWPAVGAWMHGLVAERAVGDEALTALAAELVGDATDPRTKVERLHAYVAQKVRYVRVALGIGSFQPHAAATVRRNLYGDCKDKHALLAVLLDAVGIESRPALVHSSGEVDPGLPTPEAFDHMITVVQLGDERLWLDATEELAPAGWLAPKLRGSNALVARAAESRIEQVPQVIPVPDSRRASLRGTVDADGGLQAALRVEHRGSFEIGWRTLFHQGKRGELEHALRMDRPSTLRGATAGRATTSDPLDTSGPFVVEYTVEQASWLDPGTAGRLLLPSMILRSFAQVGSRSTGLLDEETGVANGESPWTPGRAAPPDGGLVGPMLLEERVVLEFPDGFAVELPADVREERDFATYTATYVSNDGVLETTRTLEIVNTRLTPAWRDEVVVFMQSVQHDIGRKLTLTQSEPESEPE